MQYHALWQRLHHIDVGLQHNVQGWLMRGMVDMADRKDGRVKGLVEKLESKSLTFNSEVQIRIWMSKIFSA